MKRITKVIICMVMLVSLLVPSLAYAKETTTKKQVTTTQGVEAPMLLSVSFNNAKIDGEFSSTQFEYNLILDNSGTTPSVGKYKISNGAKAFVTDITDSALQKSGVNIEVQNGTVSTNYIFNFVANTKMKVSSNNYLKSFECELGEVYPALNEKDTEYSLYVPSDLTVLELNATTQDVGAICSAPESITLNTDQNPVIEVTVTASDASTRVYKFNVKRLSKNSAEVKAQMNSEDFTSLVQGEFFYQKPEFKVMLVSIIAGVCIIIIASVLLRRVALKVEDKDDVGMLEFVSEEEKDE